MRCDPASAGSTQVTLGYCGHTAHRPRAGPDSRDLVCRPRRRPVRALPSDGSELQRLDGSTAGGHARLGSVFGLQVDAADARPRLVVTLAVDANPATTGASYSLDDKIMFRNCPG